MYPFTLHTTPFKSTGILNAPLDMKLFKKRRSEQLQAVKRFKTIGKYEKQYSMILLVSEKIVNTIQASRAILESSGYIPGVSPFPDDPRVRDALSNILENSALMSEIVLRFPDISERVLRENNNWNVMLQWSIAFGHQVEYLLDQGTVVLYELVGQELNHTERDPNYVNPYRMSAARTKGKGDFDEAVRGERKKKRKKVKKGPRLSEHLEL